MKKIVIAPDKFKHSLSALEVCEHIAIGVKSVIHDAEIQFCPLADGGEGTLDLLCEHLLLKNVKVEVKDPLFRNIKASYAISSDHREAFIEMARASGLPLLNERERNPLQTSTYGTGQLIKDAISKEVEKITLFIGGSATNDGGMGTVAALGYKFLDQNGNELQPIGSNLINVESIDTSAVNPGLSGVEFIVATDVTNVLTGMTGAAHMYAAQKGASHLDIDNLNQGMGHFSKVVHQWLGTDKSGIAGAGAAGGLGFGAMVFLSASLHSGIETVIDITNLKKHINGADLVISGEGNLDQQSLHGKVIDGVHKLASKQEVPFGVVCGGIQLSSEQLLQNGIKYSQALVAHAGSVAEAIAKAGHYTELAAEALMEDFSVQKQH